MATIRSGSVTAFFLYDVAEAVDLQAVPALIGGTVAARLHPKPTTPPYVQYRVPPLVVEGETVQMAEVAGFRARFKVFDYGVVSVALTRPIPPAWPELLDKGLRWQEDPRLAADAEASCRRLLERLRPAMTLPREKTLDDIYRFAVEQTSMARGEALEAMIVLILIFELILFFMGIMQ